MLESFNLKKHLDSTRQELSHALYQTDAANRVIARLQRENSNLRQTLSDTKSNLAGAVHGGGASSSSSSSLSSSSSGDGAKSATETASLTDEISSHMQSVAKTLTGSRKQKSKSVPAELATPAHLGDFRCLASHPTHSASAPGILCLDIHSDQVHVVTGGNDCSAAIFNRSTGKVCLYKCCICVSRSFCKRDPFFSSSTRSQYHHGVC